jgi:hypothetical protein
VLTDRPRGLLSGEGWVNPRGQAHLLTLRGPGGLPGVRAGARRALRDLGWALGTGASQAQTTRCLAGRRFCEGFRPRGRDPLCVRRDHPQVTAATLLVRMVAGVLLVRRGSGGLTDRLGERDQIVVGRRRGTVFAFVPDQVPAPRRGQAPGVRFAQVIGVWLGECRERTDNCGRFGINVRQRRNGLSGASVARASTWGPHGRTVSSRGPEPNPEASRHAVVTTPTRLSG